MGQYETPRLSTESFVLCCYSMKQNVRTTCSDTMVLKQVLQVPSDE